MSKMTKTVKKGTLWSVLVVIVLVAASVVCALLGVNKSASMKDVNTLTVSMNRYVYTMKLDVVESACESGFAGNKAVYQIEGDMSGDNCEIVYVFKSDVNLTNIKKNVETNLDALTKSGAALEGSFINVTTGSEVVLASVADGTVVRAAVALAAFAVLALIYVSIRYHVGAGIVAAIATVLGGALTTAIILLARIPVMTSVIYVGAIGALLSAGFALLTLAKIRSVDSDDAVEAVASGVATKEINTFSILAIVALIVVAVASFIGAGAISTVVWFAVMAIVAVIVAWFMGIVYIPALYLPFKKKAIANSADNGEYKGAVKTSTREKKVYQQKKAAPAPAPVKEEVKEEPVEEAAEEEVVEVTEEEVVEAAEEEVEAPVEEAAEEVEAPTEEATEEEVEAPAEEVEASAEEVAEEESEAKED